jgi:integrase
MKPRSSRRLFAGPVNSPTSEDSTPLILPSDCELVAGTFVVFKWENSYCVLQVNVTLYCWGRQRSGAIEHVLEKYGLSQSPQLYRVNSKLVSSAQWSWLKQVFVVVHRLFDDSEMCESVAKVRWINIMQCGLAYDVMRRECYRYDRNLYPKGSVFTSFLKQHGVEVEPWYDGFSSSSSSAPDHHSVTPVMNTSSSPSSNNSGGSGRGSSGSAGQAQSGGKAGSVAAQSNSAPVWGDREWLSDVHIANVMFLLLHGQLAVPFEHRDLFQSVYPLTDQLFEHMLYRSDPGSLLVHAKVDRGITLVFVNPNSSHWRLVILDGLHQQVVLFDPLGVSLPTVLSRAIREFVGPEYRVTDMQSCIQAEGWNCGVWALYIASKYVNAVVERLRSSSNDQASSSPLHFQLCDEHDEYVVLDAESTSWQRYQNRTFAGELRTQYATLLAAAKEDRRLLYSADDGELIDDNEPAVWAPFAQSAEAATNGVVRAGTAFSVVRHRRFIDRPLAELVWVDLTDGVGAVEVEQEDEVEASFDDLCDQFIEFREDNLNRACAAALRYSLPSTLQSDVLKEQIDDFRAYRRQRFSLFRKGPLVEESTVSGNISALLRFLGYLHYEQASVLAESGTSPDMSVFALPNINLLVLNYVEWLEQRRGNKARAADDTSFQPVSCATVANYLNGLVSIVKFQLRHEMHLRDPLLDQLRNLRSQAESYSMAQKKFEKIHPQWCSWQELQVAREKCRAVFDQLPESKEDDPTSLLHLRELCLLGFFTICPPPRCSIVRLLEWNKTLVQDANGLWVIDLTDLAHAATRHKTHKRKGAMLLPLPKSLYPYLTLLRQLTPRGDGPVFPASRRTSSSSSSSSASAATSLCMGPNVFTSFVKTTFSKYTEAGKGPNPSLLRSIFTTWLYGLRYDTEDTFLQEIKASSAKWKAHSEQMAATVYNKDVVYQQKAFAQLLLFCETYSERYAYNRVEVEQRIEGRLGEGEAEVSTRRRSSRKRNREAEPGNPGTEVDAGRDEYVVEVLLAVRVNGAGEKQVQVKWAGYRRATWEPYQSMKQQLPEMLARLEHELSDTDDVEDENNNEEESTVRVFLTDYIVTHNVSRGYRWFPDRLNTLELAVGGHSPRIKQTMKELRRKMMQLVK